MSNTVNYYLEMAKLQIATEAFWDKWDPITNKDTSSWSDADLDKDPDEFKTILTKGNHHSSKMTAIQAEEFYANYEVKAHKQNTATGFSGTLYEAKRDIAGTDIKAGQKIMGFRSTEFVEDNIRDSQGSNQTIRSEGFAWGQIADMEDWYADPFLI